MKRSLEAASISTYVIFPSKRESQLTPPFEQSSLDRPFFFLTKIHSKEIETYFACSRSFSVVSPYFVHSLKLSHFSPIPLGYVYASVVSMTEFLYENIFRNSEANSFYLSLLVNPWQKFSIE